MVAESMSADRRRSHARVFARWRALEGMEGFGWRDPVAGARAARRRAGQRHAGTDVEVSRRTSPVIKSWIPRCNDNILCD